MQDKNLSFNSAIVIPTVSLKWFILGFDVILVTPTAMLHYTLYKPHTTHNALIRSNKGIAMESLHVASQCLSGGQFMPSTQV